MYIKKIIKSIFKPYRTFLVIVYKMKTYIILRGFKKYDDFFSYERKTGFSYTRLKAKLNLNSDINLKKPQTFNEKLIHRRLFSRDPIWPIITDKISVRSWLRERCYLEYVQLVPARFAYSVDELLEMDVDKPVVVKAAWASGMNLFVNSNSQLQSHKNTLNEWMQSPYAPERLIWAPEKMKRGFLIEDSIADDKGCVPLDYKFHCFNGRVGFMQIDIGRFESHKRLIFSRDIKRQEWCYGKSKYEGEFELNLKLINEMIAVAEVLAKDFSYIRVDLYLYNEEIYFGELTQTQGAGFESFTDPKLNIYYGDLWDYPDNNKLGDLLISENES